MEHGAKEHPRTRKRRAWFVALGVVAAAAVATAAVVAGGGEEADGSEAFAATGEGEGEMVVYKAPGCVCCGRWVEHLRESGFRVRAVEAEDLAERKVEHGIGPRLASCHTAVIDGYVIEGHVPAEDVARLLRERPEVTGLAVPGMPVGSPGMEGPNPEPYRVLAFDEDGGVDVFARH